MPQGIHGLRVFSPRMSCRVEDHDRTRPEWNRERPRCKVTFTEEPGPGDDIDALPLGLEYFAMDRLPYRGKKLDVRHARQGSTGRPRGLTVRVDGKRVLHRSFTEKTSRRDESRCTSPA